MMSYRLNFVIYVMVYLITIQLYNLINSFMIFICLYLKIVNLQLIANIFFFLTLIFSFALILKVVKLKLNLDNIKSVVIIISILTFVYFVEYYLNEILIDRSLEINKPNIHRVLEIYGDSNLYNIALRVIILGYFSITGIVFLDKDYKKK